MSTDAIMLLKRDHVEFRRPFRSFEKAGPKAVQTRGKIVDQILELLTVHTYIENEVMYPRVRELMPDLEDDILESYEEHHVADVLCWSCDDEADDERFTAKTTVLIENVEHHMDEEEQEWFPKVRDGLGRKQLQEIGAEMMKLAGRRPAQTQPARRAQEGHRRAHRVGVSGRSCCSP